MPLYDYECGHCKITVEKLVNLGEDPDKFKCEVCNKPMKRLVSASNFRLKGSGWAKDGYATHLGDVDKNIASQAKVQIAEAKSKKK